MNKNNDMSFWDHLEEFRSRLLIILLSIALGSLAGYYYSQNIIQILIEPSRQYNIISFQVIKVTSMFMIQLGVSFFGGLIIGFPFLIYHTIKFVLPAIETSIIQLLLLMFFSLILFFSGILFAYNIVIPFL